MARKRRREFMKIMRGKGNKTGAFHSGKIPIFGKRGTRNERAINAFASAPPIPNRKREKAMGRVIKIEITTFGHS